jgi:DNA replication regulator DPB11
MDGEVILSPSKSKEEAGKKSRNQRPKSPTPAEIPVGRSILSSFRRANSFAPVVPGKEAGSSLRQLPFRRAVTSAAAFAGNETRARPPAPVAVGAEAGSSTGVGTAAAAAPASSRLPISPHIFVGMSFRALGEAKTQAVRNAVEQLGGRMSTDEDEDVTFILVRLFRSFFFLKKIKFMNF